MMVTSNFAFSHSVFKKLLLQTHKNQGLFEKGLIWTNPYFVVWERVNGENDEVLDLSELRTFVDKYQIVGKM